MLTNEERLQKARELCHPLQRRYGTMLLLCFLTIIALCIAPIPMPVVATVGAIILFIVLYVGMCWHFRHMRVLHSLGP